MVFFSTNEQNVVTLLHSTHQKHEFLVKTKKSTIQKKITKRKVSLDLFYQILGHMSTRLLRDGDNANVWQCIDMRVDPDPFSKSCQKSTMNKKPIPNTPLKPKTPFNLLLMGIIISIFYKHLTKDTNFDK